MKYLITGGTGTFGRALLEMLLKTEAEEIRIFSRDETKQWRMMQEYQDERIKYYIGDVREAGTLDEAMRGGDVVFHAAAMKHVGSCEAFPDEAIKTNVTGTQNAINIAIANKVPFFVLISTDKAVYPISTMGATKLLAENLVINAAKKQKATLLTVIRFGNLINSRGSVTELWTRQIKKGEACTITNPDATRFFITVKDAIEFAVNEMNYRHGQIVHPPMKAESVWNLFLSFDYEGRHQIKNIGLHPGERMHEFITAEESSEFAERYTRDELKKMIYG